MIPLVYFPNYFFTLSIYLSIYLYILEKLNETSIEIKSESERELVISESIDIEHSPGFIHINEELFVLIINS